MEEKALIVENNGFFANLFRRITNIFSKKTKKQVTNVKSEINQETNTNVDKMFEIKNAFESNNFDLTTLSNEELRDLELIYDVQIKKLNEKIASLKQDIDILDEELISFQ